MRVRLLVYSGQENPSWHLTETEAGELVRRFSQLSRDQVRTRAPGLGYSGFLVENPDAVGGLPAQLTVYRGVHLDSPAGTATLHDDQGLEDWLLTVARQRGHGSLLDALAVRPPDERP